MRTEDFLCGLDFPTLQNPEFVLMYSQIMGFPGGAVAKSLPASARDSGNKRCKFDSWVWKILWRRKWIPTPVFLPGKFHGERSLAGYSPWGHEESDTTECACTHTHTHTHTHTYSQFSVGFTLVVGKRNIFILFFF